MAIAFFDITAEVEARERLRRVVDSAPIMLFAHDMKGIITLSEGQGLASIGVKPGDLVGQSVLELYKNDPEVLLNTKRSLAGEAFSSKARAGPYVFESTFAPLRNAAGEQIGVIGVSTNVTERENLQAQLIEADRMASLGTIAASVAHEINTPLAYVAASLDHIDRSLKLGSAESRAPEQLNQVLGLVAEARQGVDRVTTIARDLNTFSRPQERLEPLDVRAVLDSALRMTSHETLRRARIVRDYQDVPLVNANEARLARVFLNLLMNAAQAIPAGTSAQNEIRATVRSEGGKVVVEIMDSGRGIDPAAVPRIFEPFFTTKPLGQGTGLGLSICRNIVGSLGGEITFESRPGRTLFVVRLPESPAAVIAPSPVPPSRIEGRPRVLVIDDDLGLRRVLGTTLASVCDLEIADSANDALARLVAPGRYDLVFCDLMMPDMTGMALFESLRSQRPGLERTICFMTGGAFTPEARDFLASVSNPCFQKPFDFFDVITRVLTQQSR